MASSASNPTQAGRAQKTAPVRRRRRALKSGLAVILLIILASVGYGLLAEGDRSSANESVPTAEVMRGDLTVTVEERGDVYSMRPLEIKSQVEGRNTLLELVDEGTVLTQKDVDEGRVIARLDSSTLEETVADRQISVFQAEASYVQAKEDHDIQVNQCKSNIAAAELKLKFARLDAERYLGSDLAIHMLAPDAGPVDLIALARAAVEQLNAAAETGVQAAGETAEQAPAAADESDPPMLGGDAEQQLRTLTTQVQLAAKELAQAQDQLDWSQKLAARDYISTNDLEGDQLRAQRAAVRLRTAQEGLSLFLNYTLQKDAEQNLSDCTEAQRNLERVQARSRSQLTQSEANLKSKEASFNLEKDRLQKAETMLANCTIRAPKPGRVAYGSSAGGSWGQRGRGQVNIELGAAIPENQVILRIPDTSALSVKVNISEKDIDKVAGQGCADQSDGQRNERLVEPGYEGLRSRGRAAGRPWPVHPRHVGARAHRRRRAERRHIHAGAGSHEGAGLLNLLGQRRRATHRAQGHTGPVDRHACGGQGRRPTGRVGVPGPAG
jgi:multidrug resistance efflux pump